MEPIPAFIISFELTDLEKKFVEQFNIAEERLNDLADDIVQHLLNLQKVTDRLRVNGRVVLEVIDEKLSGNDRIYVQGLFKPGQQYSMNEIRSGCKLGKFESEVHFAGENDLLIMLPDSKLILSFEIKRHMKCQNTSPQSSQNPKIDGNMRSASSQLKKNADFISTRHGAILSPDWRFVKICAISPSFKNPDNICKNCNRFVLTSDILKTPGGLDKW